MIDRLAGPEDHLWPRDRWPAVKLDTPLSVGARGGHGPIRYEVVRYEPGRAVAFRFVHPTGLVGEHRFEYDGATLRHVLEGGTTGSMRVGWPLAFRWLHDALAEDALDRAEGRPPRRLGLWVRILRWAARNQRRSTRPSAVARG